MFLKKAYMPIALIMMAVAFFVFYNNYLVDRSLINLQAALVQVSEIQTVEGFKKLKPLLRIPLLVEISKTAVTGKALASLGMIENIIDTAKTTEQIEDIKFYLKDIIADKEKERGGFLSLLDRFNQLFFKPITNTTDDKLWANIKHLSSRIAATKDPNISQSLYYELGNSYAELGNLPQAETAFLKAVDLNPKNTLAAKSLFNLAWTCKAYRDFDKALEYFNRLIDLYRENPISLDSRFQLADMWFKKGDYRKAVDEFGFLGEEHPEFNLADLALYGAGYVSFYNLNDKTSAIGYFNRLEEIYPKAKVVQNVMNEVRPAVARDFRVAGFRLLREGKYQEAVDSFTKAVEVAPLDYRSYSGMALGLLRLQQRDAAVEKAGKAVDPVGKDDGALLNAMYVFIKSGMFDDATNAGERVLEYRKNRRPEVYYNLGNAYYQKKDYHNAIIQYEKAIKRNPDFSMFYNNLGCALWAVKDYSQSIYNFREAVSRDPQYEDAHYNLGVSYYSLSRLEDAYKEFEIVVNANPKDKAAKGYLRRIGLSLNYQP